MLHSGGRFAMILEIVKPPSLLENHTQDYKQLAMRIISRGWNERPAVSFQNEGGSSGVAYFKNVISPRGFPLKPLATGALPNPL
jgi:hypothetical protein